MRTQETGEEHLLWLFEGHETSSWKSSLKMLCCCRFCLAPEAFKGAMCPPAGRTWMIFFAFEDSRPVWVYSSWKYDQCVWTGALSPPWSYQTASALFALLSTKGTNEANYCSQLTLGGAESTLWRYYCTLRIVNNLSHCKETWDSQCQGGSFLHTIKWAATNAHEKNRKTEIKMLPCWNLTSQSLNVHLYFGFS